MQYTPLFIKSIVALFLLFGAMVSASPVPEARAPYQASLYADQNWNGAMSDTWGNQGSCRNLDGGWAFLDNKISSFKIYWGRCTFFKCVLAQYIYPRGGPLTCGEIFREKNCQGVSFDTPNSHNNLGGVAGWNDVISSYRCY
ncbi:hypothetical protein HGRIS_000817 [Hohenbuehelia grisea]|uniref:Secreted protein n=1 Tax=Hohenbuehelia grisea TaxID=104357 RepID=A0ABR3IPZ0_9AGAR